MTLPLKWLVLATAAHSAAPVARTRLGRPGLAVHVSPVAFSCGTAASNVPCNFQWSLAISGYVSLRSRWFGAPGVGVDHWIVRHFTDPLDGDKMHHFFRCFSSLRLGYMRRWSFSRGLEAYAHVRIGVVYFPDGKVDPASGFSRQASRGTAGMSWGVGPGLIYRVSSGLGLGVEAVVGSDYPDVKNSRLYFASVKPIISFHF